jgi:hypothetical protein
MVKARSNDPEFLRRPYPGMFPGMLNPRPVDFGFDLDTMSSRRALPLAPLLGPSSHRRSGSPFSPELRLPPITYLLDLAGHPSGSGAPWENTHKHGKYHSADFNLRTRQCSETPAEKSSGSQLSLSNNNEFLWNHLPNAPATSINGGTFVSGNVNNIQRHGETGECCD